MCHHTLKSLSRAVSRMPKMLMSTCGIMTATMTASWNDQLVAVPNTGTATSAGHPPIRVTAPIRYVAAATLMPAVIVTWPIMLSHAVTHAHVRPPSRYAQK